MEIRSGRTTTRPKSLFQDDILDTSDLYVEAIDLLGNRVGSEVGVAFFVASYSALRKAPVSPALLILGDMSVQGNISLSDRLLSHFR